MTTFNGNCEAFTNCTGLYRIWMPLHDDGRAPLISIRIDPAVTALESQAQEEPVTVPGI